MLYFPSGSVVSTYSLATGEKLNDLRGHLATVNAAAWSTRSAGLLTGSTDKQLLVWNPGEASTDSSSGTTLDCDASEIVLLAWVCTVLV